MVEGKPEIHFVTEVNVARRDDDGLTVIIIMVKNSEKTLDDVDSIQTPSNN